MKTLSLVLGLLALPSPEVQTVKHRVMGLFGPEREADLREAVKKMAGVEIVSIDLDVAEVTFSYDPAKLFPQFKEKDRIERFNNLLRQNSSHTFGIQPLFPTPREKLQRVEIGVVGMDCKGCCLAVYEIVAKVEGVAQATANLKEGHVSALIDPEKANQAALEDVLKKRQVTLKPKK